MHFISVLSSHKQAVMLCYVMLSYDHPEVFPIGNMKLHFLLSSDSIYLAISIPVLQIIKMPQSLDYSIISDSRRLIFIYPFTINKKPRLYNLNLFGTKFCIAG